MKKRKKKLTCIYLSSENRMKQSFNQGLKTEKTLTQLKLILQTQKDSNFIREPSSWKVHNPSTPAVTTLKLQ